MERNSHSFRSIHYKRNLRHIRDVCACNSNWSCVCVSHESRLCSSSASSDGQIVCWFFFLLSNFCCTRVCGVEVDTHKEAENGRGKHAWNKFCLMKCIVLSVHRVDIFFVVAFLLYYVCAVCAFASHCMFKNERWAIGCK